MDNLTSRMPKGEQDRTQHILENTEWETENDTCDRIELPGIMPKMKILMPQDQPGASRHGQVDATVMPQK